MVSPQWTLIVAKTIGQNTVAVADAVRSVCRRFKKTLPAGFKTEVVGDQSVFIKASIESIQTHLLRAAS